MINKIFNVSAKLWEFFYSLLIFVVSYYRDLCNYQRFTNIYNQPKNWKLYWKYVLTFLSIVILLFAYNYRENISLKFLNFSTSEDEISIEDSINKNTTRFPIFFLAIIPSILFLYLLLQAILGVEKTNYIFFCIIIFFSELPYKLIQYGIATFTTKSLAQKYKRLEELIFNLTPQNLNEAKLFIHQFKKEYVQDLIFQAAATRIFDYYLYAQLLLETESISLETLIKYQDGEAANFIYYINSIHLLPMPSLSSPTTLHFNDLLSNNEKNENSKPFPKTYIDELTSEKNEKVNQNVNSPDTNLISHIKKNDNFQFFRSLSENNYYPKHNFTLYSFILQYPKSETENEVKKIDILMNCYDLACHYDAKLIVQELIKRDEFQKELTKDLKLLLQSAILNAIDGDAKDVYKYLISIVKHKNPADFPVDSYLERALKYHHNNIAKFILNHKRKFIKNCLPYNNIEMHMLLFERFKDIQSQSSHIIHIIEKEIEISQYFRDNYNSFGAKICSLMSKLMNKLCRFKVSVSSAASNNEEKLSSIGKQAYYSSIMKSREIATHLFVFLQQTKDNLILKLNNLFVKDQNETIVTPIDETPMDYTSSGQEQDSILNENTENK